MKRGSQSLAVAIPLAILAASLWFVVPLSGGSGGGRRWVWLIVLGVLGLWLLACARVKKWLQRGEDTPRRLQP